MSGTDVRIHRASDGDSTEQGEQKGSQQSSKYVAGPGFEIAVRAGSVRELDVQVPDRAGAPQEPRRPGQDTHHHPAIEHRLNAIEASLKAVLEQLTRIEQKVDRVGARPID